ALSAFGNGDVYVEKYVLQPKHVEIQIMADSHGNVVHLFERDCSVQRRHQKVIEESPCAVLDEETRRAMGEVAVKAAQAVDYVGAGTVEFLLDVDKNFYFLEMNTRLQVEHPVTEMITSLDLVRLQLRVADGEPLGFTQDDLVQRGSAIECRIYAEDPEEGFRPCPGEITYLRSPSGPWVREDSGVYSGGSVPVHYDPMIAKLIVWGEDRAHAIARMRRALSEYVIQGITTNVGFFEEILTDPRFVDGTYDTGFLPELLESERPRSAATGSRLEPVAEIAAVLAAHRRDESLMEQGPSGSLAPGSGAPGRGSRWKSVGRQSAWQ
ncbi:MAG: acetyl-CoA carboxylase biotin carboxylase subunit, partial [Bradymonadaceae bacterium]